MKAPWVISLLLLSGCVHHERVAAPPTSARTDQPQLTKAPPPSSDASPPTATDSTAAAPPNEIRSNSHRKGATPGAGNAKPTGASHAAVAPPSPKYMTPPALDLTALEQRLRDTHAIGVFTKLSLKNQVDDLLNTVRAYHSGRATLQEAKQQYDLLLLKVLTLLQDGDAPLASSIRSSRDALWNLLADRDQFLKLHL